MNNFGGDWKYRTITGLAEIAPGYKELKIAPKPGSKLTQASAELNTVYGLAKSSWLIENDVFKFDVIIPSNASAQIILPNAAAKKITERSIDIAKVKVIKDIRTVGGDVYLTVGSGTYRFEYPFK